MKLHKNTINFPSRQLKEVKLFHLSKTHLNPQISIYPHSQKNSIILDYVNKKLEDLKLNENKSIEEPKKMHTLGERSVLNSKINLNDTTNSKRKDIKRNYETFNQKPITPIKDNECKNRSKSKKKIIETIVLKEENKRLKGVINDYQNKLDALEKKINALMMKSSNNQLSKNEMEIEIEKEDNIYQKTENNLSGNSIHSLSITFTDENIKENSKRHLIKVNPNAYFCFNKNEKNNIGK